MLLAAVVIGAATALAALVYVFLTQHFSYWKKRGVVSPEPKILFGHIKDSILRQRTLMHVLADYYNTYPDEKIVGILRTINPCLLIRDLDIMKHVFIKDFDNFVDRGIEFSKEGLGMNLFHADGDTWRVLRSKLSPIFSSGKLKNMFHLIEERSNEYIKYTDKVFTETPELNIYPVIQEFTMSTISACAFGMDLDFTESEAKTVLQKIDKLIFTVNYSLELSFMFPKILKAFNSSFFPKFVGDFFYKLVQDILKLRNGEPSNRKDFMDLLIELQQKGEVRGAKKREDDVDRVLQVNDHVMAAQAFVFYAAGYETSASTMTMMLHELAFHQDIQDRLAREISEVIQRHGGKITYEGLKEMTYLNQVFDETLRKYPIVDPIFRKAQSDYEIPGTDVILEKNTPIIVSVRAIHYDASIYPEPDQFDPERFSPENANTRHPCAYLPFGTGPRNCIGMRFARVQSAACLAALLPRWRLRPGAGAPRRLHYDPRRAVLASLDGVRVRMERREPHH